MAARLNQKVYELNANDKLSLSLNKTTLQDLYQATYVPHMNILGMVQTFPSGQAEASLHL